MDETDLDIMKQDVARKRDEVRRLQHLDDVERARGHDEYSSDAARGFAALLAAEEELYRAQWDLHNARISLRRGR